MATILVIDDCEEFRQSVVEMLQDAGYSVRAAASPDEARKVLQSTPCDLILCDLVMPVDLSDGAPHDDDSAMVGVHTIHELSRVFPKVPVIATSGEMEASSLSAMDTFGASDCLPKPFGREQLLQTVERVLSTRPSASP